MNKLAKTLMIAGTLALGGALAQTAPANPQAPAQPGQQAPQRPGNAQQKMRGGIGGPGFNLYFAAAQNLGVTPQELRALSNGTKTLAQIATDLGKTPAQLEAALVTARNQGIDQAQQAQRLTAEQAAQLKASSAAVVRALVQQPVTFGPMGMGRDGRDGRGPGGPGRGPNR